MEVRVIDQETLQLLGNLDVFTVAEFKDTLVQQLQRMPDGVTLDLSGIRQIDLAGVQLLIACQKSLGHGRLRFCNWAPALSDLLALTGLTRVFA